MSAFYFGDSEKSLFGYYHAPKSQQLRDSSIVICNPIGHEYNRSFNAIKNLAVQLSKQGFNVLRFNYYATGDSAGASDEGNLKQWVSDVKSAYNEVKDMSGERNVSIIGMRFGASLAMKAAKELKFQNVLLWEPIFNGEYYMQDLEEMQSSMLTDSNRFYLSQESITETSNEFLGHPYSNELQKDIRQYSTDLNECKSVKQMHVISSSAVIEYCDIPGIDSNKVVVHRSKEIYNWNDFENIENMLIANDTITEIVSIFGAK